MLPHNARSFHINDFAGAHWNPLGSFQDYFKMPRNDGGRYAVDWHYRFPRRHVMVRENYRDSRDDGRARKPQGQRYATASRRKRASDCTCHVSSRGSAVITKTRRINGDRRATWKVLSARIIWRNKAQRPRRVRFSFRFVEGPHLRLPASAYSARMFPLALTFLLEREPPRVRLFTGVRVYF